MRSKAILLLHWVLGLLGLRCPSAGDSVAAGRGSRRNHAHGLAVAGGWHGLGLQQARVPDVGWPG